MPFPCFKSSVLDPGAKPLEPFGERLECSEGGSTGRRAKWPLPADQLCPTGRPFSSQPGSTERAVYRGFGKNARQMLRFRRPDGGPRRRTCPGRPPVSTPHSDRCLQPGSVQEITRATIAREVGVSRSFSLTERPSRCLSARFLRQIEYGQIWRSLSYFRGRAARP